MALNQKKARSPKFSLILLFSRLPFHPNSSLIFIISMVRNHHFVPFRLLDHGFELEKGQITKILSNFAFFEASIPPQFELNFHHLYGSKPSFCAISIT